MVSCLEAAHFLSNTEFKNVIVADADIRIWSFDLSAYDEVQTKVSALKPDVAIGQLPKFVLKLLKEGKLQIYNMEIFIRFSLADALLLWVFIYLSFVRAKGTRFFLPRCNRKNPQFSAT